MEYLRDGQLEMDGDPEGQSSGYDMTTCKQFLNILQVWGHCLTGRENCFQQSDRLAGHMGEKH